MDNRCPLCGRKQPCQPCSELESRAREDALLDEMAEEDTPVSIVVWFDCSLPVEHLNRLRAEWPYALETIEPTEPGDLWGAAISRHHRNLGINTIEYEVTNTRIAPAGEHWMVTFLEKL